MSIKLVVCLAALLGLSFAAHQKEVSSIRATTDWSPPKWYRGKDGPQFEIIQTLDEVELRGYEAGKWVTTNITGLSFDDAYKQGTEKLDDYWKGNNQPQPGQPGAKIDNTVPTVVLMYPTGQTKAVQQLFTVEYFLPHELHAAPPQPTTAELNILDVQPNRAWVRVFGGYAGEKEVMDQAFGFLEQLKSEKLNIDESVIAVAYYDDPVRIINRHNEIWIWSKDAPSVEEKAKTWLQRLEAVLPWRR